jgi:hypothetical protein
LVALSGLLEALNINYTKDSIATSQLSTVQLELKSVDVVLMKSSLRTGVAPVAHGCMHGVKTALV